MGSSPLSYFDRLPVWLATCVQTSLNSDRLSLRRRYIHLDLPRLFVYSLRPPPLSDSPVRVVLADDVQDVALDKVQAGFLARDVRILAGHVRKVRPHANLSDQTRFQRPVSCTVVSYFRNLLLSPRDSSDSTLLSLTPLLLSAGTILKVIVPSEFCWKKKKNTNPNGADLCSDLLISEF